MRFCIDCGESSATERCDDCQWMLDMENETDSRYPEDIPIPGIDVDYVTPEQEYRDQLRMERRLDS